MPNTNSKLSESLEEYKIEPMEWPLWLECLSKIKFIKSIVPHYSESDKEDMLSTLKAWKERLKIECLEPPFIQILDGYVKADKLAIRYQNQYRSANFFIYIFSVLAIAIVSVQTLFLPNWIWLSLIEASALIGIILVLRIEKQRSWHKKWLDYRYLTERFRSAFFLTAVGRKYSGAQCENPSGVFDPDSWMNQYFDDYLCDLGKIPDIEDATLITSQRDFIREQWVDNQCDYHRNNIGKRDAEDRKLHNFGNIVFYFTLFITFLNFLLMFVLDICGYNLECLKIFTFISLVFPAIGASLNAIRTQLDCRRMIQHSRSVEISLTALSRQLRNVGSDNELDKVLHEIENVMMSECQQWYALTTAKELTI